MRHTTEEAAHLAQRLRVVLASREHGGVGEGGRRRDLGGFGGRQHGTSRPQCTLHCGLTLHRGRQDGRVELHERGRRATTFRPPAGCRTSEGREHGVTQRAVPVVGVVTQLRRSQHERHRGGEPAAGAVGHGRAPHAAQRARPRRAACAVVLRLGLHECRDDDAVVVRGRAGELPVLVAQRQAQPAEMGDPVGVQRRGQPVPTRADDAEHERNPQSRSRCQRSLQPAGGLAQRVPPRTTSTSEGAYRSTLCATLPSSARSNRVLDPLPITMRSAA